MFAQNLESPVQVTLNKGMDIMSLEPAMTELKLTPEALDIPVPDYLIHRHSQVRHIQKLTASSP